jgi:hypothetical protein
LASHFAGELCRLSVAIFQSNPPWVKELNFA